MLELLTHWFAAICGQNPDHTWAPGGVLLPCCQRCAGLYLAAGLALMLLLCCRPRLSAGFLYAHGAFLLLMVPFGFHWVPHGPLLRTMTGYLFGIGLVGFLWVPVAGWLDSAQRAEPAFRRQYPFYFGAQLAGLVWLLAAAQIGGAISAAVLMIGIASGAFGILALILVDGALGLLYLARSHAAPGLEPPPS